MAGNRKTNNRHADAIHRALEEENAAELATALLKAAIHYSGHWGNGEAAEVIGAVRARPVEFRRRLVDRLAETFRSLAEDSPARVNALALIAAAGRDLPGGGPLSAERLGKFDELGRMGQVHSYGWVSELVLAELDAGARSRRPPSPPCAEAPWSHTGTGRSSSSRRG